MYRLQELVRLHRMGCGAREVRRILKIGCNTEREYRRILQEEGLLGGDPQELPEIETLKAAVLKHKPVKPAPQQTSTIEEWIDEIRSMVKKGASPKAIFDYLRLERDGFSGSYSAVKRRVLRLKKDEGIKAEDVAIPVVTDAGEVAQVDFGYVGRLYDPDTGRDRRAWVFVMTLGYSRHMYAEVVFNQRVETWLQLHVSAFRAIGGVTNVIVPDNLKSAVVRAAFGVDEPSALNRSYRELARFYDFKVDPTPPRAPKKKGKVESSVKYVKRNYFRPRDLADINAANEGLEEWVQKIAGTRTHGTTGRKPLEVFVDEEQGILKALPKRPWEQVIWKKAKVHRDSHIQFDKRLYSVPWQHIGKEVWVRATPGTVAIYQDDDRIATHDRRGTTLWSTVDDHLPAHRVEYRYRSRSFWEERADKVGPETGRYIREVFDSDDALSKLRCVQSMVRHLETFPKNRAEAACTRALYYSNYNYGGLKSILRKGLDMVPLPAEDSPASLKDYRYSRPLKDLFNHKEKHHASN